MWSSRTRAWFSTAITTATCSIAATIERWLHHLETLLEGLVANPRQYRLGAAAAQLTPSVNGSSWNGTIRAWTYPREKCVHHFIGEQAARTPQAIAAVCGNRQLTYAQLDSAANRLAHFLRKRGVGTGDRVAICLDRSLEMLIGVLGVLKAGAAYVPLDPDFPPERIAAVIEDAHPSLLLYARGHRRPPGGDGDQGCLP